MPSPSAPGPTPSATAGAPRVLAVDGNSLAHRAFHSARAGFERGEEPAAYVTGAVVSMLATAWSYGPYATAIVGLDHPVNRRKLDEPGYKANRPAPHPDLAPAIDALAVHLDAAGLPVVTREGAEADDVLAAVADACAADGLGCDLLSSDRDLTALIGPTTRLLRPRHRFRDLVVEDEAAVLATYGVPATRYVELAALRGDPSDGLEGARGIGPKTAARLLREHDSIPALYAALHELPPKLEASLREARSRVERNLLLMSPIPHLQVEVTAAVTAGLDPQRIGDALEPLELTRAARRLQRAITAPAPPPPPPPPGDADAPRPAPVGPHDELPPAPTRRPRSSTVGAAARGVQGQLFDALEEPR